MRLASLLEKFRQAEALLAKVIQERERDARVSPSMDDGAIKALEKANRNVVRVLRLGITDERKFYSETTEWLFHHGSIQKLLAAEKSPAVAELHRKLVIFQEASRDAQGYLKNCVRILQKQTNTTDVAAIVKDEEELKKLLSEFASHVVHRYRTTFDEVLRETSSGEHKLGDPRYMVNDTRFYSGELYIFLKVLTAMSAYVELVEKAGEGSHVLSAEQAYRRYVKRMHEVSKLHGEEFNREFSYALIDFTAVLFSVQRSGDRSLLRHYELLLMSPIYAALKEQVESSGLFNAQETEAIKAAYELATWEEKNIDIDAVNKIGGAAYLTELYKRKQPSEYTRFISLAHALLPVKKFKYDRSGGYVALVEESKQYVESFTNRRIQFDSQYMLSPTAAITPYMVERISYHGHKKGDPLYEFVIGILQNPLNYVGRNGRVGLAFGKVFGISSFFLEEVDNEVVFEHTLSKLAQSVNDPERFQNYVRRMKHPERWTPERLREIVEL